MTVRARLRLNRLEARDVPSGNQIFALSEDGSSRVAVYEATGPMGSTTTPPATGEPASPLSGPFGGSGRLLSSFEAFPGFAGGVTTAVGDVTGDGVEDLIVAAGAGGGPHVKVYDGSELLASRIRLVSEFFAYEERFRGGVSIATGQFNPETPALEIITGAGQSGGPHVKVFRLDEFIFTVGPGAPSPYFFASSQSEFFAFDSRFTGGVRVAAADMDGDGRAEAIVAAGPGGGPHVRVFDVPAPGPLVLLPYSHRLTDEFFAYAPNFRGGVYVAAGELDGNPATAEIVTGAGESGGPHVRVWGRSSTGNPIRMQSEFFASHAENTQGVRVGIGNLAKDATRQSIYTGVALDVVATVIPAADPRLGAYQFQSGSFVQHFLQLPDGLQGRYNRRLFPSA